MVSANYSDVNTISAPILLIQSPAMELVGVTGAAKELDLSTNRVRQLIKQGRLPAQRIGREYAITRDDLEAFKLIDRPVGRPPREPDTSEERAE